MILPVNSAERAKKTSLPKSNHLKQELLFRRKQLAFSDFYNLEFDVRVVDRIKRRILTSAGICPGLLKAFHKED